MIQGKGKVKGKASYQARDSIRDSKGKKAKLFGAAGGGGGLLVATANSRSMTKGYKLVFL